MDRECIGKTSRMDRRSSELSLNDFWQKICKKAKKRHIFAKNFGNVLQNSIFKDPDFTSRELFNKKAKEQITNILNSTDKTDKKVKSFMEHNEEAMNNCVDNISAMLDSL